MVKSYSRRTAGVTEKNATFAFSQKTRTKISVARSKDGKITRGIVLEDTLMQDAYLALSCLKGECKTTLSSAATYSERYEVRQTR